MMQGCVFDIQRFSLDDGPGIRTVVFLQGCNQKCPWCHNPESLGRKPVIMHVESRCTLCGRCAAVCPEGAVSLKNGRYIVDHNLCTVCGKCVEACLSGSCRRSGTMYTPEEVMKEVRKDKDFYLESGGGLTLSGGEPSLQSEFAAEILKKCKEEDINTAIETNGNLNLDVYRSLEPFLDAVMLDLKHADPVKHEKFIGCGNTNAIATLKYFAEKKFVEVRVPVIPGFNDTSSELQDIVDIASESGAKLMRFLPYHIYGIGKYHELGQKYEFGITEPVGMETLKDLLSNVDNKGMEFRLGMS